MIVNRAKTTHSNATLSINKQNVERFFTSVYLKGTKEEE